MSTVHVQIEIDAPPQAVWDIVMDPNRLGEWVTIHRSVRVKSPLPPKEGARMDQVLQIHGVPFRVHWTLESMVAARSAEWIGRGPALSRAVISYRLTGGPEGPTKFDYVNEFHPPGGPIGDVASKVLIGHVPEREAHESLTRLKALIEGK